MPLCAEEGGNVALGAGEPGVDEGVEIELSGF